jgi:hypothetical protein
MATNEELGNSTPGASVEDGATLSTEEILYSTQGWTQKGVTIAPGIGIIERGTVMGQVTATKLWVPYTDGADNGAGSDVARGVLRQSVDTGTAGETKRYVGNIVIRGILKSDLLSGATANALTDLGARTDTVLGTFTF